MQWQIHTLPGKYKIYNEDEKLVGEVKKKLGGRCLLEIFDGTSRSIGTVSKNGEQLAIHTIFGEDQLCAFCYEIDDSGRPLQKSLFRPPRPVRLKMHMPCGHIDIIQSDDRNFSIVIDGKNGGKIKHMADLRKTMTVANRSVPPEIYIVLFAVSTVMFHDDDIEIV